MNGINTSHGVGHRLNVETKNITQCDCPKPPLTSLPVVEQEDEEEQAGALLVEDGDHVSCDSEDDGGCVQIREAAWVDEDDEQEEE